MRPQLARYEYDSLGNITRMATGVPTVSEALDRTAHSVTDYEYSFRDFLIGTTDPMGYTESYTYNSRGTLTSSTDKNGTETEYTYNGAPWLLSKTATGTNNTEQSISYIYDYLGNITQMVDENGTTLYTYDRLGNILTETRGTLVKEYEYDKNGNRTSALITDGTFSQSLTYSYDNNNRLTRINDENGYTSYTYDKNNRILTEKTCNTGGVSRAYSKYEYYDSGLLSTKKNYTYTVTSPTYLVDEYALTYYADGNIATVDNNDSVTSYVYDSAGRLSSESIDGTLQANYTYDAFGNRATMANTSGTTTYTYDKNNRLTQSAGITYTYDNNGNLLSKSGTASVTYTFDLLGRMTGSMANNISSTYTYDGNGIRTSKTVGGVTTNFINDGAYVVGEVSGDSIVKYTYGLDLISINNNGTLGYYHTDEHGNVSAISDKSRNIVANYDFDAFGNETSSTDAYYNPMRYCDEYYDVESGLTYLRARYYDPSIGRFISEDPIKDGTNWYVYCGNNPIAFVDPSGLVDVGARTYSATYSGATITGDGNGATVKWNDKTLTIDNSNGYLKDGHWYCDDSLFVEAFGVGTKKFVVYEDPVLGTVSIRAALKISGNARSSELGDKTYTQLFIDGIEEYWTGTFGTYQVSTYVESVTSGGIKVNIDHVNLKAKSDNSYMRRPLFGWKKTNPGKMYMVTGDSRTQTIYTASQFKYTSAHEFGHILGVGDAYNSENKENIISIFNVFGTRVQEGDITKVLNAWNSNKWQTWK